MLSYTLNLNVLLYNNIQFDEHSSIISFRGLSDQHSLNYVGGSGNITKKREGGGGSI